MKILIIGGTRFIGPRVVARLIAAGHEVTLFNRGKSLDTGGGMRTGGSDDIKNGNSSGGDDLGADSQAHALIAGTSRIIGDRRALDGAVSGQLKAAEPEVVIDMCCLNEADARGMLDVFKVIARRYVLVSSCDVYRAYGILNGIEPGEPVIEPTPVSEDSPLRTRLYPYRGDEPRAGDDPLKRLDDYDKIPAERLVLNSGAIEGVVLRLPMVYGPDDYQRRLRDYASRMTPDATGFKLAASLANWRTCRGYVDNVAAAIALASEHPQAAGRVYNVAEQPAYCELEWARLVAQTLDWPGEIVAVDDDTLPEDQRPQFNAAQHLDTDTARIRAELGYAEPVALNDALRLSLDWELAQQLQNAADSAG